MATTYGMTAPMMSSTMPNPMGTVQTAMSPSMMGQSPMGMNNANMNLPLSTARPIEVTETTPNLEQIQNFPVAGRAADGTHFHQDPVSGQMYRMSAELHDRIPEILRSRNVTTTTLSVIPNSIKISQLFTDEIPLTNYSSDIQFKDLKPSPDQPTLSINNVPINVSSTPGKSISSIFGVNPNVISMNDSVIDLPISLESIKYSSYSLNQTKLINQNLEILYRNPVNKFNNFSVDVMELGSITNKIIPINSFIQSKSLNMISNNINYYTPINKFYNK